MINIDIWNNDMMKKDVEPPYDSKNLILFCEDCGYTDFEEHTIAYEADIYDSEKEVVCIKCGKIVNYWSYGYYCNDKSEKYLLREKQLIRKEKLKQLK